MSKQLAQQQALAKLAQLVAFRDLRRGITRMTATGLRQTHPAPMHAILSLKGPVVVIDWRVMRGQRLASHNAFHCSGRVVGRSGCPAFQVH